MIQTTVRYTVSYKNYPVAILKNQVFCVSVFISEYRKLEKQKNHYDSKNLIAYFCNHFKFNCLYRNSFDLFCCSVVDACPISFAISKVLGAVILLYAAYIEVGGHDSSLNPKA